ncbi:MAG: exodeoxyribonuclease VII small subunit [Thioalkalivibrionaceae bacterium]
MRKTHSSSTEPQLDALATPPAEASTSIDENANRQTTKRVPTDDGSNSAAASPIANFEIAFSELEAIVERLESGGLSLDETLAEYERGVQRVKLCQRALDAADARLTEMSGTADDTTAADDDWQSQTVRNRAAHLTRADTADRSSQTSFEDDVPF